MAKMVVVIGDTVGMEERGRGEGESAIDHGRERGGRYREREEGIREGRNGEGDRQGILSKLIARGYQRNHLKTSII